jgi:hypothetical protein
VRTLLLQLLLGACVLLHAAAAAAVVSAAWRGSCVRVRPTRSASHAGPRNGVLRPAMCGLQLLLLVVLVVVVCMLAPTGRARHCMLVWVCVEQATPR